MAADLSQRLGWITKQDVTRTIEILKKGNLPTVCPKGMGPERFKELMAVDKKVLDGKLRLVLLKGIGEAVTTSDFQIAELDATLEHLTH